MKKKNGTIELYHLGETLVQKLLQELSTKDFLSFLEEKSVEIYPNTKSETLKRIESSLKQSSMITPKIEVPFSLQDKEGREMECDPNGLVDVCIFNDTTQRETKPCIPVEVKMGLEGQAKSWSDFNTLNLGLAFQEGSSKKIKGAVPSFLSKKYDVKDERVEELKGREISIAVKQEEENYTFDSWLICGRRARKNNFQGKGKNPQDTTIYPLWFAIEDLAEMISEEKIAEIVNQMMDNAKTKLLQDLGVKSADRKDKINEV